jgi:DNA modification methylase/superfamily II DNA or RNA helicase
MTDKIIDCTDLTTQNYQDYLDSKMEPQYQIKGRTIIISRSPINTDLNTQTINEDHLFDYQKFILTEAIKRQRYAVFADCGLGKTAMFHAWIRRILPALQGKKVLIITPLMVLNQTLDEEEKFYHERTIEDIHEKSIEDWAKNGKSQVAITNFEKFYEKKELYGNVAAVVLDESSILKNGDGKTRTGIIETTRGIPWKLACSATPAPNDREEYASHATFLEYVRSNNEFFSMFFVNSDEGWQIKPHGLEAFYQYLSSWSVYLRQPEHYGFNDNLAKLPKPIFETIMLEWTDEQKKMLTNLHKGALDRKHFLIMLSKGFYKDAEGKIVNVANNKIATTLNILAENKNKPAVIWVTYNYEQEMYLEAFKQTNYNVAEISGATQEEQRVRIIEDFRAGKYDVLISKPKLLGFGLNLPFVTVQIFSGLTDSYEQFYQCVRRSHRFGATEPVKVYLPVTNAEKHILSNVMHKKDTFEFDSNKQETDFIKNLQNDLNQFFNLPYETKTTDAANRTELKQGRDWQLFRGDSIKILQTLTPESIDMALFSPPFANLFTYSNNIADMGNTRDHTEFYLHFEFFLKGLYQAMKQGRIVCCHLSQLATLKSRDGFVGLHDFRGDLIRLFQRHGFIYFGEWCIAKSPQMQAIKEKVRSLSFAQLEADRLGSKPGLNDYILIFKKPGEASNKVNDSSGPSRDEWINWATGVWADIKDTDTMNVRGTKGEDDVKHICPMNLQVIRRCIRMYSAPGELVLDPFNGIGSTGVIALEKGRKYIGIELKEEYFDAAVANLEEAKPMQLITDFFKVK